MVYLQGKVYKGQHKRRKRVLKYLKSAIFFYFKLNEKNKVLLKKMVWKKVLFKGGKQHFVRLEKINLKSIIIIYKYKMISATTTSLKKRLLES